MRKKYCKSSRSAHRKKGSAALKKSHNMPARLYKRGPRKTQVISCPNCSFRIRFGPPSGGYRKKGRTREKSAARVARGKRLAAALPRDERGRFLPMGSENRYFPERMETGSSGETKRKGKERIYSDARPRKQYQRF